MSGDDHGYVAWDHYYYNPGDGCWYMTPDNPPLSWQYIHTAVYVPTLDNGTVFCTAGCNVGGLVDLINFSVAESPSSIDLRNFGFAAMANPVKGVVNIAFTIGSQAHVMLRVYDRTGRMIEQLVDRPLPAGFRAVPWNTSNVANGVYFLRLDVEGQVDLQKMVVVK
jgi:hypothetical protein